LYAIQIGRYRCWVSGNIHRLDRPNEAALWNDQLDTLGCGLLLNPQGKLSIFFTVDGILMGLYMKMGISSRISNFTGNQIPINPETGNCLIPTVAVWDGVSVEANFGDDLAKPFKYNLQTCPTGNYSPDETDAII
jgi:hypothetical protein